MAIRYGWRLPLACQSDQVSSEALPARNGLDFDEPATRNAASPNNDQKGNAP
jgi:hypothetical protein